jgi:hypothetical protein
VKFFVIVARLIKKLCCCEKFKDHNAINEQKLMRIFENAKNLNFFRPTFFARESLSLSLSPQNKQKSCGFKTEKICVRKKSQSKRRQFEEKILNIF